MESGIQEIAQEVKRLLALESVDIKEIPAVESVEGITSLPAVHVEGEVSSVVRAPLTLLKGAPFVYSDFTEEQITALMKPGTDAAQLVGEAVDRADNSATAANEAAALVAETIPGVLAAKTEALEAAEGVRETADYAQTQGDYAKDQGDAIELKAEAALRNSKEYTDGRETIIRADFASSDNTMLVSAKAYADTVVAALVDSAPDTLNTLQELAEALNDDPNFASTMTNELAKKLDKTGGTVTGPVDVTSNVSIKAANPLFLYSNSDGYGAPIIWRTEDGSQLAVLRADTDNTLYNGGSDNVKRTLWDSGQINFGTIRNFWTGTQAEYDALSSDVKNNAGYIFFIK